MAGALIQARGRVLGSLTKIKTFSLNINNDTAITLIEVRLEKLEELWVEFKEIEDKLSLMYSETPTLNIEFKQDEFEDKFFETKSLLVQRLREKTKKATQPSAPSANSTAFDALLDQQRIFLEGLADRTQIQNDRSVLMSTDSIRLPRVNIEPFTGEYDAWPSFQDLYLSSVHNVASISKAHKFQILKGLLRDKPLQVIRNLLVTDANYDQAWEKLVSRYNKKKPILKSLIMKFMDQTSAINGSAPALRRITDESDEIISGIRALGIEAESRDPWLIQMLLAKVDEETRELWSRESRDKEFPTASDFLKFLNERCDEKESSSMENKRKFIKTATPVKSLYVTTDTERCPCCKRIHPLNRCLNIKQMSISKRRRMVNEYNICYNCLKVGHMTEHCESERSCQVCNHKHHSLLHLNHSTTSTSTVAQPSSTLSNTQAVSSQPSGSQTYISQPNSQADIVEESKVYNATTSRYAFLPTAVVYVRDSTGNKHKARALLDSGSQSTFVTESLVQRLNLDRSSVNVKITGIAETMASSAKGLVNICISSRYTEEVNLNASALILPKVASTIPSFTIDVKAINKFKHLQLADPTFYIASKIDLLIGADMFFKILNPEQIEIQGDLIIQSTKFGWIVTGQMHNCQELHVYTTRVTENNTHKLLENFWKLEEVPSISTQSETQHECEDHYKTYTTRNAVGRYVVRLPFTSDAKEFGSSKSAAIARLLAMERKFKKDQQFETMYKNFMEEYIHLGHMEEIKDKQIICKDSECFYLPHHAVVKSESTTTKLRVVFDGSCKSSSGISLNENLLVGPTIQRDLVSLILKFRSNSIAFSADIDNVPSGADE